MNNPTYRLLLVEDDPQIRRFLRVALDEEGFEVFEADTVKQALVEAATRRPDLAILDLGLPDGDGKRFITGLRTWSALPVLVLSARDREHEKVAALDAGADDYLTQPFGVPELLARLRALLRRHNARAAPEAPVRFGVIEVDLARHEVRRRGEIVHLTLIEFRLLAALIRGQGRVLTYRQLLLEVWGPAYIERAHYLRVHMANLRQKLEDEPARPKHLVTELAVGYRLVGLE